jgi:hypothetical protein
MRTADKREGRKFSVMSSDVQISAALVYDILEDIDKAKTTIQQIQIVPFRMAFQMPGLRFYEASR